MKREKLSKPIAIPLIFFIAVGGYKRSVLRSHCSLNRSIPVS
jgi:hypothetical protein